MWFWLMPYDEHKEPISPAYVNRYGNEAVITSYNDATIVTDRSLSGWYLDWSYAHQKTLAFYYDGDTDHLPDAIMSYRPNWSSSTLSTDGAYSSISDKTIYLNIAIPSNIASNIVLWTTKVMNQAFWSTYIYTYENSNLPQTWITTTRDLTWEDWWLWTTYFRKGTKYVKILVMPYYGESSGYDLDLLFKDIVFEKLP